MNKAVRVRFAPSPTGGLHIGGMRTVLYNYLFARQHGGKFVLRIEDTDRSRYVEGAEQYIYDCLEWCGLVPDESPVHPGPYGPYRQSERRDIYARYARKLVESGHAYLAFDTPEELDRMREAYQTPENPTPRYDASLRKKMRNSLTLPPEEVKALLEKGTPYVVRILMPDDEEISFNDMIRGTVSFHSRQSDDKVLLKADGMPTYHLAVVVDDYEMNITHAFRGEEWLPSAPVHILLWRYLGIAEHMPHWAHLPLILKPDGKGKLSKRDGERLGFPVFATDWKDPSTGEITRGFRERGFLPEAFINMLALVGWNDGSGQEIFSLEELVEKFAIERVHKAGARFDFDKAKWFNHEWIKRLPDERLREELQKILQEKGLQYPPDYVQKVVSLIRDRCILLPDLWTQSAYFFQSPREIPMDPIAPRWNAQKSAFFREAILRFEQTGSWAANVLEEDFKKLAADMGIKAGEVLLPLRIMLVGAKEGPAVFSICEALGREETISRVQYVLNILDKLTENPNPGS